MFNITVWRYESSNSLHSIVESCKLIVFSSSELWDEEDDTLLDSAITSFLFVNPESFDDLLIFSKLNNISIFLIYYSK